MKRTDFLPAFALSVLLLSGIGLTFVAPVWSADNGHGFRVLSAQSYPQDNLYLFDADVALRFSDEVLDALDAGVPITIAFEGRIAKHREYVWDKTVSERTWMYQLRYHSLTQRHVITDLLTGDRHSYRARHAALIALGRVHALPLIESEQLEADAVYVARLRVSIDIEALPAPLRLPAYLSNQWDLESDWYEWPLAPASPL